MNDRTLENADASQSARVIAARLARYRHRRRTLLDWMHPLRRERLWRTAGVPGGVDRSRTRSEDRSNDRSNEALAEAVLADAGVPVPPLACFASPGAALALINPLDAQRIWRLRVLCEHADEIRAWIDRPRRALLAQWLGESGVRVLLSMPRDLHRDLHREAALDAGAPDIADTLAARGFERLARECGEAFALMRFALPNDALQAAWPELDDASTPRTTIADALAARLPELLVEAA
ncbi:MULTISPECIES: type III secretion protein HrpB4 [unclassified Paraburkholderia]|uniref:type III secretion protein HrpB4 n=1 Tax=unclassified Paraburkholderia TaxID=2615204 RepID=UPI002AB30262|nr:MULTISPECIES: type III secretion protein HrpB4 [unclassified Paraburkholderia]